MTKLISIGPISAPSSQPAITQPAVNEASLRQRNVSTTSFGSASIVFEKLGVQDNPFGFTPNPRYLYLSRSHAEARASLIVGLECGMGFQALIAPPGMGKTTILFDVLEHFKRMAHTAFLFQLQGDARDFLRYLALELGSELHDSDVVQVQDAINRLLIQERRRGRRTIVVIDEAQTLSTSVLEAVRLLSNFETPFEKLLQIVLAGQPQLAKKLAAPELAQLQQRILIVKTLQPLDMDETNSYIEHRLKIAGYHGQPLFTPAALKRIWEVSHGVPREINTICFNALLLLTAVGRERVDPDILQEVIGDLQPLETTGDVARPNPDAGKHVAEAADKEHVSTASAGMEKRHAAGSNSYIRFYHFKRAPFDASPDTACLCFTSTHSAALANLYSGLLRQERVMRLTGEPGTGKTLLSACLVEMLKSAGISAEYLPGQYLRPGDILKSNSPSQSQRDELQTAQRPDLDDPPDQGVLFIDEAHELSLNTWREIQLLATLPVQDAKLQIVVMGTPQVEQSLMLGEFRELRSRIEVDCRLQAFDQAETGKYITSRIELALDGPQSSPVFSDQGVAAVNCYAQGIPRLINLICDRALIRGHALRERQISGAIVHDVAKQCPNQVELHERVPRSNEGDASEPLKAARVLLEFHAELQGLRPEGGRRRCNGGNRPRDYICKPWKARD
ncbi:MAG: peptidoglycan-binding ATPase [Acidobacteriaceae bacterium]|nr:peptidoglycan-binding ATPase [Acidobacteriaceae bacterium]